MDRDPAAPLQTGTTRDQWDGGLRHSSHGPPLHLYRPCVLGWATRAQWLLTNLRSEERLTLRGLTARSGSTAATSSPVMSPAATVFSQSEPEMLCRDRGLEGTGSPPPPARQCHPPHKPGPQVVLTWPLGQNGPALALTHTVPLRGATK